jgi:hypothetical protein
MSRALDAIAPAGASTRRLSTIGAGFHFVPSHV